MLLLSITTGPTGQQMTGEDDDDVQEQVGAGGSAGIGDEQPAVGGAG